MVDLRTFLLYTSFMGTSSYLLAIDPGLHACGLALFHGTELFAAGAVRGTVDGRGPGVWAAYGPLVLRWLREHDATRLPGRYLLETMKQYRTGSADPADLLELGGVGGAVVGALHLAGWVPDPSVPRANGGVSAGTWNGQVKSHIRRQRTMDWVESMGWQDRVDLRTTKRHQEDVWSAVGIGRWGVTGDR